MVEHVCMYATYNAVVSVWQFYGLNPKEDSELFEVLSWLSHATEFRA